MFVILPC